MTTPTPSIRDLKKGFIASQMRTLSTSIEPPRAWQSQLPESPAGDLPDSVVAQALYKFNVVAKRHHRLVYSSQALSHVASQIQDLYQQQQQPDGAEDAEESVLRRGVDLREAENIALLPDTYPNPTASDSAGDLERYQELHARLTALAAAVQAQRERHAYYTHLKALVEPFRAPMESVQPNLVTRDGALGAELERMRMLAGKLAFAIERAGLERKGGEEGEEGDGGDVRDGEEDEVMERLRGIMDGVGGGSYMYCFHGPVEWPHFLSALAKGASGWIAQASSATSFYLGGGSAYRADTVEAMFRFKFVEEAHAHVYQL
ncbi:kinetochore complex Fta4 of Sim4 subunit, or CENP-50-domain-containing protein [Morchella snyderi]|nr:kinetochore complex Fta4 of Sim4 subunit, or CENP-50-domain-containing protein [Morchella snyderi]